MPWAPRTGRGLGRRACGLRGDRFAGDPVAIVLPNGAEFLVTFLATTWALLIAAPLNPAYKVDEFKFYMEDIGVKAVIVPPGEHPARDAARQMYLPAWEARLGAVGRVGLVRLSPDARPLAEGTECADGR